MGHYTERIPLQGPLLTQIFQQDRFHANESK